MIIVVSVLCEK